MHNALKLTNHPVTLFLLFSFGVGVDLLLIGQRYIIENKDWPGWIQAAGSLYALSVTIFVMARQNAHAVKLALLSDNRAFLRRATAVDALIDKANTELQNVAQQVLVCLRPNSPMPFVDVTGGSKIVVSSMRNALLAIPVHELGSYEMVRGVLDMIDAHTFAENSLDDWHMRFDTIDAQEVFNGLNVLLNLHLSAFELFKQGMAKLNLAE